MDSIVDGGSSASKRTRGVFFVVFDLFRGWRNERDPRPTWQVQPIVISSQTLDSLTQFRGGLVKGGRGGTAWPRAAMCALSRWGLLPLVAQRSRQRDISLTLARAGIGWAEMQTAYLLGWSFNLRLQGRD